MEWTGSRISWTVPQPCDGRCWNRPTESRSPCSMLSRSDSWYAVASAMLAARAGSPRWTETAAMRAAFSACSRLRSTTQAVDLGGAAGGGEEGATVAVDQDADPDEDEDHDQHRATTALPSRVMR